jgi:hypothetical protein
MVREEFQMNVTIELPPHIENVMRRRASAAGQDLAAFVRQVVTESAIEDSNQSEAAAKGAAFFRRMDAWIALHPVLNHAIDDSRESIYAGRGE